jgi:ADP-heptose:LPS heptosyltransferase
MILVCPKYDKASLEEADIKLTELSKKIVTKNKKIKVKNAVKDFFKSFSCFLPLMFKKKDNNKICIAVVPAGGIGDLIRQKDAISMLGALFPFVVIDIYNRGAKRFLADIKNVRFFFDRNAVIISRKKYDIVVDFLYKGASGIGDMKINNQKNDLVKKFAAGFEEIKREYPYCFNVDNHYIFQKKAVENGLRINDVMKLTLGIKDIKKDKLTLNYKDQSIKKFGLSESDKYITFQHGWGDKGYIPRKTGWGLKLWGTANWKNLLRIIKRELKDYKIVQIGINSVKFEETDINLNGKTSFDELCAVLKHSSLHIDTDCGCVHIAKMLNVQSVVLFGPTNAKYIGYDNNINIMSGLCRNCYTIVEDDTLPCIRGFAKPLCMNSIAPDFVAKIILEHLR